MRRGPFGFISAASLGLCAFACVIWALSYCTFDSLSFFRPHNAYCLDSHNGRIFVVNCWIVAMEPVGLRFSRQPAVFVYEDEPYLWRHLGIGRQQVTCVMERGDVTPVLRLNAYSLPWWMIIAAAAVLPARTFKRLSHTRSSRGVGFCSKCGYDLRATLGRCPECGAVPSTAT